MLDFALDFLLVRKRLARARAYSPAQQSQIAALTSAADVRAQAASELRTRGLEAARGILLREALVMRTEAAELGGHVIDRSALNEAERMRIENALASTDLRYFDSLDAVALGEATEALAKAERDARKSVEPSTLPQLRKTRAIRVVVCALALAWIGHRATSALLASPNVAFHKEVLVDGAPSVAAAALVDGKTGRNEVPVVTRSSFTVDLAGVYVVDRVRVFNRRDSSLDGCLPLVLETSNDGQTWSVYDRLHDHFVVWDEPVAKVRARYVRVRTEGEFLGLNEIEVFGRYGK